GGLPVRAPLSASGQARESGVGQASGARRASRPGPASGAGQARQHALDGAASTGRRGEPSARRPRQDAGRTDTLALPHPPPSSDMPSLHETSSTSMSTLPSDRAWWQDRLGAIPDPDGSWRPGVSRPPEHPGVRGEIHDLRLSIYDTELVALLFLQTYGSATAGVVELAPSVTS